MEGIEVPSFFLCPISLQTMRDPVTLSTGITYDRESIEHWLFKDKHDTCPITKQSLTDRELITPNHTLRQLIQAWCVANASFDGIERFPTPRPPVDRTQVVNLIEEARSEPPQSLRASLKKLKLIVCESDRNRRCVELSGAVDFLACVIESNSTDSSSKQESEEAAAVVDEALDILDSLHISEQGLLDLIKTRGDFIETLTAILQRSSYQSRAYASLIIKSLVSVISPASLMALRDELFIEMVKVLKDRISYKATKAVLQVLSTTSPWGRSRIKAVEAGAVSVLIELLLDETEKKGCEMMLAVLSRLSECAEGRAEIVEHAAGMAVVSKNLVRVSITATERAVKIMHLIAKFSPTSRVLKEMLEFGAVSDLCLLVQMDCGAKTKDRVREILRLHSRAWRNSACVSPKLQGSYTA